MVKGPCLLSRARFSRQLPNRSLHWVLHALTHTHHVPCITTCKCCHVARPRLLIQLTRMTANLQRKKRRKGGKPAWQQTCSKSAQLLPRSGWHQLCKPHVIAEMWFSQQASCACKTVQMSTHLESVSCCMLASNTRVVTQSLLSKLRKCAHASSSIHCAQPLVYWRKQVIIMLAVCLLAQVIGFRAREAKRSRMPRLLRTFSSFKKERYAFCLMSCLMTCLGTCLMSGLVPCLSSSLRLHTS